MDSLISISFGKRNDVQASILVGICPKTPLTETNNNHPLICLLILFHTSK